LFIISFANALLLGHNDEKLAKLIYEAETVKTSK
jgi:hypothetical protein